MSVGIFLYRKPLEHGGNSDCSTKNCRKIRLRQCSCRCCKVPLHISTCPRQRDFLYCQDPVAGIISNLRHLDALTNGKYAPYKNVTVLPHLDHADPFRDHWALTVGSQYFSSVMFDAQCYEYEKILK